MKKFLRWALNLDELFDDHLREVARSVARHLASNRDFVEAVAQQISKVTDDDVMHRSLRVVTQQTEQVVNGEAFVDRIIERIRKKQL